MTDRIDAERYVEGFCWHCGDGIIIPAPHRERCENCPDECDVEGCDEPGCGVADDGAPATDSTGADACPHERDPWWPCPVCDDEPAEVGRAAVRARAEAMRWLAGDSPCPVHDEDEEDSEPRSPRSDAERRQRKRHE